ncbi:hypothetical protein QQP08_025840 [Theobroma cacao]|nr:hypothetical protein QQP08_025840 [Theobroma cacao]
MWLLFSSLEILGPLFFVSPFFNLVFFGELFSSSALAILFLLIPKKRKREEICAEEGGDRPKREWRKQWQQGTGVTNALE